MKYIYILVKLSSLIRMHAVGFARQACSIAS